MTNSTDNTKYENLVAVLNDNITTVKIRFYSGDKLYTYKCPVKIADTLEVGDQVLPEKAGEVLGINGGYVAEIDFEADIDPQSRIAYRWVIQKVDRTIYDREVALEAANVEKLKKERRQQVKRQFVESMGLDKNVKRITELKD